MNIKRIKEKVESLKNKKIKFKLNGTRNQIEEFEGIITEIYNYQNIILCHGTTKEG